MNFPSKLIENAVTEISKLPGIGKKTALRLALHLLKEEEATSNDLAKAITELRSKTVYCKNCHNISDRELCNVCSGTKRDRSIICVVEDTRDVLAIENTSQYHGLYHILGGVISPMEGIGPSELNMESLLSRISSSDEVKEIILALSPTMEGDTTAFYITRKLKEHKLKISTIARGIPVGGELEYTDEITLGRSIISRTTFDQKGEI
ncbi:MAG: recombination mediator RecR [Cytophagaceae bacterium]